MQCFPADANRISCGQSLSFNRVSKSRKDEVKREKGKMNKSLQRRHNEIN